jgi:putative component of toxin-antitoxin plasmid stabilization module
LKRIVARFYAQADGTEPVKEWLRSLDRIDRQIIGSDIASVEFGWPVGMPLCRPVGEGIREVRSSVRGGRLEARTYFAIEGGIMLLLHGDIGKDGQQHAIRLARRRLKEHEERSKWLGKPKGNDGK